LDIKLKEEDIPKQKRSKKQELKNSSSNLDLSEIFSNTNEETTNNKYLNDLNLTHKRSLREKKATIIEDIGYIDKDKSARSSKNPISAEIFKKCEKIFAKLKRHALASDFMTSSKNDAPSLNQIEKLLRNYTYQSVYQFGMDVRKIWNYYFSNFSNNNDIYQKAFAFSNFFEMIFKEVDNNIDEKNDIHELNKKLEKLTKEIKEIDRKNTQQQILPLKKQESRGSINLMDKAMSMQEKNMLGNNIRLLTQEQLKGVINIVSDNIDMQNTNKYFEFDIETLPTRKLRELEKYTRSCLKTKGICTPKSAISIQKGFQENNGTNGIHEYKKANANVSCQ